MYLLRVTFLKKTYKCGMVWWRGDCISIVSWKKVGWYDRQSSSVSFEYPYEDGSRGDILKML